MRASRLSVLATAGALCAAASLADASEVVRHPIPGSDFPIAAAVEIPPGATTVYLSGAVPRPIDPDAPRDARAAYGDTAAQTTNVLEQIQRQLESLGLGLGDVVKMQVFLVGDEEKDGRMDFAGFMESYRTFFGTEAQPNLPARSAMQIAGLVNPAYLVEIEVVAVRP